jgi:hypothetical protein
MTSANSVIDFTMMSGWFGPVPKGAAAPVDERGMHSCRTGRHANRDLLLQFFGARHETLAPARCSKALPTTKTVIVEMDFPSARIDLTNSGETL